MKIERREFIGISAVAMLGVASSGSTSAQPKALDLTEKSLGELQSLMERRVTTSVAVRGRSRSTPMEHIRKREHGIVRLERCAAAKRRKKSRREG